MPTSETLKTNQEKRKVIDFDPAQKLTNKILCQLRKENKFTNKEYFDLYPSHPIPPRLYITITEAATGCIL